jgi:hypothetical protein
MKKIASCLLMLIGLAGCNPPSPSSAPQMPAALSPKTAAEPSPAKPEAPTSISRELAGLYLGLLQEIALYPERDAVTSLAKIQKWRAAPKEMLEFGNAKIGYVGRMSGHTVLMGSDGSNDIFSLMVNEDFEPRAFVSELGQYIEVSVAAEDSSMGQKLEMYRLRDGKSDLGFLYLNYGIAGEIVGSGGASFISSDRAKAEGIGKGN